MINISYHRLFNLVVSHQYFVDGHDSFTRISPTAETQSILKKGKILFKNLPNGITLLYRTTDYDLAPFVNLDGNQNFVFQLEINDIHSFLNITDLDESALRKYKSGNVLYFTNTPSDSSSNKNAPEILDKELLDSLRGELFAFSFAINSNPPTSFLTVRDGDGIEIPIGTDTEGDPLPIPMPVELQSNGTYSQQIDLRERKTGKYTITVANNDGTSVFLEEKIYVDGLLAGKNIAGIINIKYDGTNELYNTTEEYKLSFNRLSTNWKYFIVNKSGNVDYQSDTIIIKDGGSTNGSPYQINAFSRAFASIHLTADTAGPDGNNITLSFSGNGNPPAMLISGNTLSGGEGTTAAIGMLTIINNEAEGYTITIDGVDFKEGNHFSKGTTAADTAADLLAEINSNDAVKASATMLAYDVLINDQHTIVFTSNERIPFFEKPKPNIELRNETDLGTIVPHLSNPSPSGKKKEYDTKVESEIYVFI